MERIQGLVLLSGGGGKGLQGVGVPIVKTLGFFSDFVYRV